MKNNKLLDLTNGVCWSIIFSLAAIIMSIVALADTHPRALYSADDETVVLGFDYIGVIVGILTLLVTLLVAWNIWQTITTKTEIRDIRDEAQRIKESYTNLNSKISDGLEKNRHFGMGVWHYGNAHALRLSENVDDTQIREAYYRYLEAIVEFLKSYPEDYIDRCLAGMKLCQEKKDAFTFTEDYDKSFVERCDKLFEEVEVLYSVIDKKHKELIKELNHKRKKYHNKD